MLAIRRKLPVPKLVTSGVLAFTIGLTASAAYLSTTIERMPYNFSTLQSTAKKDGQDKQAEGVTKTSATQSSTSSSTALPVSPAQSSELTSEWMPYSAPPQQNGAPTSPVLTSPVTTTVASPSSPTPVQSQPSASGSQLTDPILQPVTDLVDSTVRVIVP